MDKDHHPASNNGVVSTIAARVDFLIGCFESFVLATAVLLMAANTIANVIGRFVFHSSLFFSEEVNRILIVMITFAGIGYAARHGRHIRMSAIYDVLSWNIRKIMMIFITLFSALVMLTLCYFSIQYISKVASSGRILPALQIPVYWIYLWVPVGFLITAVQYALTALKNMLQKDIYLSVSVLEGYEDSETEV
ncbi:TRAP transporter small permease [Gynuella sp.]|uniref:TRAP transporter small permease n=1 Tax=Gynuella sp. TaxID=2969146 RepID=UPI003D147FFC